MATKTWINFDTFEFELQIDYSEEVIERVLEIPKAYWSPIKKCWIAPKQSAAEVFFQPFFDKLAGGPALRLQLQKHTSVRKIRRSWQPALQRFESQRKPYLLYPNPLTP